MLKVRIILSIKLFSNQKSSKWKIQYSNMTRAYLQNRWCLRLIELGLIIIKSQYSSKQHSKHHRDQKLFHLIILTLQILNTIWCPTNSNQLWEEITEKWMKYASFIFIGDQYPKEIHSGSNYCAKRQSTVSGNMF